MRQLLVLLFLTTLSGRAVAEDTQLTGRWGLGFDTIPGASVQTNNLFTALAAPNALSLRYWVNERLAWEGLLAAAFNSQPPTSIGGSTLNAGTDQRSWGLGTGIKVNAKPTPRYILPQFIGKASMGQSSQQSQATASTPATTVTTSTVTLFVGGGFEAFIPVWPDLSVEGSVGLQLSSTQTKVDGSTQAAQTGSSLGVAGYGFSPINVAVHLYF